MLCGIVAFNYRGRPHRQLAARYLLAAFAVRACQIYRYQNQFVFHPPPPPLRHAAQSGNMQHSVDAGLNGVSRRELNSARSDRVTLARVSRAWLRPAMATLSGAESLYTPLA